MLFVEVASKLADGKVTGVICGGSKLADSKVMGVTCKDGRLADGKITVEVAS